MSRFVLIPPPFVSHIRVFEALADRLTARGHEAVFLLNEGGETHLDGSFPIRTVGPSRRGDLDRIVAHAANPGGPFGILRMVADIASLTDALCRDGASLLHDLQPDAVIGDELEPAGSLLAGLHDLPFISVAAALPIDPPPGSPLPYLDWRYDPSPEGLRRHAGGAKVARLLLGRQRRTIEAWSRQFGLPTRHTLDDCLSPILRLSQTVPEFDFPRPREAHYAPVGPIRRLHERSAFLPFEPDPARPLVFASLGTLQGHRRSIFEAVARGCRRIGAQLAVAHCGCLSDEDARSIGADFTFDFLPLDAVMRHADICVTHGGLNTVMDALSAGVPLLCIPIAFDQPGIAARIAHHGVGEVLSRHMLSSRRIADRLRRLIASGETRGRAAAIGRAIQTSGGAERAADLIEASLGPHVDPWMTVSKPDLVHA